MVSVSGPGMQEVVYGLVADVIVKIDASGFDCSPLEKTGSFGKAVGNCWHRLFRLSISSDDRTSALFRIGTTLLISESCRIRSRSV